MAVGNLFRLVVKTLVFEQECQNVFWYRQSVDTDAEGNDADALGDLFTAAYSFSMQDALSNDAEIDSIEVINYMIPSDYSLQAVNLTGEVVSESAPSMYAIGVRMGRPMAGWNYPSKRFAGFPASYYVGNDVDAGVQTALLSLANSLRTLTGSGRTFQWIIFRGGDDFALGSPTILEWHPVGAAIEAYESVQRTRRA